MPAYSMAVVRRHNQAYILGYFDYIDSIVKSKSPNSFKIRIKGASK